MHVCEVQLFLHSRSTVLICFTKLLYHQFLAQGLAQKYMLDKDVLITLPAIVYCSVVIFTIRILSLLSKQELCYEEKAKVIQVSWWPGHIKG